MWDIYTMDYYSAIKKNKIMPFAATWMDLEIIILNKVRKRQISYNVTNIWNLIKEYKWTYLENRLTNFKNKHIVTKGKK